METTKPTELLESLALTNSLIEKVRRQIEKTETLIKAEIRKNKELEPQEVPTLLLAKKAIQLVQKYPSDWEGFRVKTLHNIISGETFSSNYLYQLERLINEIQCEIVQRITEQEISRANQEGISYNKTELEVKQWRFFYDNYFHEREREAYVLGKCHEKYFGWEIHFSYDLLKNQDIHEIGLYNGQTLYSNNIKRNPGRLPKHLQPNDTNGISNWVKSLIDELEDKWTPIFEKEYFEKDCSFQTDTGSYTEIHHGWTICISYDTKKATVSKIAFTKENITYANYVNGNSNRIPKYLAVNDIDGVLGWLESIIDELVATPSKTESSEFLTCQNNWESAVFNKNHFEKANTAAEFTVFEDNYRDWIICIEFYNKSSQISKITATKGNLRYVFYGQQPAVYPQNLIPDSVSGVVAWVKTIIDRGSEMVVLNN